jgi:hypothetical protein
MAPLLINPSSSRHVITDTYPRNWLRAKHARNSRVWKHKEVLPYRSRLTREITQLERELLMKHHRSQASKTERLYPRQSEATLRLCSHIYTGKTLFMHSFIRFLCVLFVCFCFVVLGFELGLTLDRQASHLIGRRSTTWAPPPALFLCVGYFCDRVSGTICLGWPWTKILLIFPSWVARITDTDSLFYFLTGNLWTTDLSLVLGL